MEILKEYIQDTTPVYSEHDHSLLTVAICATRSDTFVIYTLQAYAAFCAQKKN